jgi:tight adherence protein C
MQAILQYPEFIVAGLLTLLVLKKQAEQTKIHAPSLVSAPAFALLRLLPMGYIEWLQRWQNWAGWRNNSAFADLAACKLLVLLAAMLLALVIPPILALVIAGLVFFLPDLVLVSKTRRRQQVIRDSLPQALDLMVLCVDAGLGLDATLKRISSEKSVIEHALNDELTNLGRDLLLGMERERAYQELYNRTGVEEMKTLGSALNQSAKMGISIGRVLRTQSEFLRQRLSQKAEEKALKLPIWMSFPLWFCIMPALMLVLIGPSIINFLQQVHHFPPEWF